MSWLWGSWGQYKASHSAFTHSAFRLALSVSAGHLHVLVNCVSTCTYVITALWAGAAWDPEL